jgi:hypothetical protein
MVGIKTVEAANVWLSEHYIAMYNAAFAVAPDQEGIAFVADRTGASREALCIQEERRVGNDDTIAWPRLRLRIPASRIRQHYVRAMVRAHEYPDGQLAIFHGSHRLADYWADGTMMRAPGTKRTIDARRSPDTQSGHLHASATSHHHRSEPFWRNA